MKSDLKRKATHADKETAPEPANGTRAGIITARQIEAAATKAKATGKDEWLTDPAARGAGRLGVRCRPSGARSVVYRFTKSDGTRDALVLGNYDPTGVRGLDLTEARDKAGELQRLHRSGITDLREHFAAMEQADKARTEAEREAAATAQARAERGSLQALLDAYCKSLEGRQSHDDAEGLFRLHVTEAFPALAQAQAATIKAEQFRDVLAKLIDAGKGRTAAKLRAYLRAAYSMAMRAGLDPTIPGTFSAFGVEVNQLERLPSLSQFSKALDRALTLPELHAFWKRLQGKPEGAARDAITAALLLGGQRPRQLLRAVAADVDESAGTLVLRDIKGRNRAANPRRHLLPIVAELAPIIKRRRLLCQTADAPLFSATGDVQLRDETASELVGEICADMAAAGELERGPFQMRDLRRTAETHMAALGISSDVRAQIQSHGLGGIQQRHYDKHDYLPEKRAAIELWALRLQGKAATVTPIKSRRKVAA
ncbi:MAG: integrase family protein [Rubrivivax sp.]|nr:integrase family protein [Rubrivivax sp.]